MFGLLTMQSSSIINMSSSDSVKLDVCSQDGIGRLGVVETAYKIIITVTLYLKDGQQVTAKYKEFCSLRQ